MVFLKAINTVWFSRVCPWRNKSALHSRSSISAFRKFPCSPIRLYGIVTNQNMSLAFQRTYEDAVKSLNGLQSNASVIARMRQENAKDEMHISSIPDMELFLSRLGIQVEELNRLNVIHVSGTKGKGSVCSFCESIMRHSGLKTGFYSSPHLVEVRERIRIDGKPLSREAFAKYFFECYDKLIDTAPHFNGEMPSYFRFLTLMALHVYLDQNVDVAILEVGIGGSFDCTNVVRKPTVCGITKLEIDHASVLGRTIEQIAWHKAGILKRGRPAVTITQEKEAQEILFKRAQELQADLFTVPKLSEYETEFPEFSVKGHHQHVNAAIALQLTRIWFHQHKQYVLEKHAKFLKSPELRSILFTSPFVDVKPSQKLATFQIPDIFLTGLKEAQWLGRCQVFEKQRTTFFLDGAHTSGSIRACVQWFKSVSQKPSGLKTARVLCFFITGDRDSLLVMKELREIDFDFVVFCPTILHAEQMDAASDLTNFNRTRVSRLKKCDELRMNWIRTVSKKDIPQNGNTPLDVQISNLEDAQSLTAVFPSISSAIRWIVMGRESDIGKADDIAPGYPPVLRESNHVQVLVAGSLHLVGGVLKFLGPEAYLIK